MCLLLNICVVRFTQLILKMQAYSGVLVLGSCSPLFSLLESGNILLSLSMFSKVTLIPTTHSMSIPCWWSLSYLSVFLAGNGNVPVSNAKLPHTCCSALWARFCIARTCSRVCGDGGIRLEFWSSRGTHVILGQLLLS